MRLLCFSHLAAAHVSGHGRDVRGEQGLTLSLPVNQYHVAGKCSQQVALRMGKTHALRTAG